MLVPPQPEMEDPVPFLTAAAKYGVMPAIVLWLVYLLSLSYPAQMKENTTAIQQQTQLLTLHVETTSNTLNRLQQTLDSTVIQQGRVIELLRQQCVNDAHNYLERNACFAAGTGR